MPIDPHIFRAYDIRGRAEEQLTTEACQAIAIAFGTVLRRHYDLEHPRVALGWDARTHSPGFAEAVTNGLRSTGCHVLRIGPTPSPVNYFTICDQHLDGGIQITASHNPAHDNGLKLQRRDAEAYAGQDLQDLRMMIERDDRDTGEGRVEDIDASTPYIHRLSSLAPNAGKGLHIAVDAGNGIAGPVNCRTLRAIGCTLTELYTDPDGTFPNHQPDPSKHDTLRDLQRAVTEGNLACGLAFDGDGDRLGLVDETGTIRTADEILLLLARDHLSRNPGAPVVFTVSNSSLLQTEVERWGGTPVMTSVGHSHVEQAMREHNALLGGEQSGHFFCGENYEHYDDALAAALRVLAILQAAGSPPLSSLFDFPRVYQAPERRPHCPDDRKTAVVQALTDHFAARYPVNTLDGARIDFGDGAWAGIRQSNTSPCLSICIEARSPEKLQAVEQEVLQEVRAFPEVAIDKTATL